MPHAEIRPGPEDAAPAFPEDASRDGPVLATGRDRLILAVFWLWAGLLVVAALAHLFGWNGVLDALDVKRWFAR